MMYLDVRRSGTFLLYNCKAPRLCDVEHSVILRFVFAISSALVYLLFSGNVPLLHMSRYVMGTRLVLLMYTQNVASHPKALTTPTHSIKQSLRLSGAASETEQRPNHAHTRPKIPPAYSCPNIPLVQKPYQ